MLIKALPKGLDSKLVEKGLWKGDKATMGQIQQMLSEYRLTPENENLDGVVAFRTLDDRWSEVASLGLGGPKIRRSRVPTAEIDEFLIGSFCSVIPPILRR